MLKRILFCLFLIQCICQTLAKTHMSSCILHISEESVIDLLKHSKNYSQTENTNVKEDVKNGKLQRGTDENHCYAVSVLHKGNN